MVQKHLRLLVLAVGAAISLSSCDHEPQEGLNRPVTDGEWEGFLRTEFGWNQGTASVAFNERVWDIERDTIPFLVLFADSPTAANTNGTVDVAGWIGPAASSVSGTAEERISGLFEAHTSGFLGLDIARHGVTIDSGDCGDGFTMMRDGIQKHFDRPDIDLADFDFDGDEIVHSDELLVAFLHNCDSTNAQINSASGSADGVRYELTGFIHSQEKGDLATFVHEVMHEFTAFDLYSGQRCLVSCAGISLMHDTREYKDPWLMDSAHRLSIGWIVPRALYMGERFDRFPEGYESVHLPGGGATCSVAFLGPAEESTYLDAGVVIIFNKELLPYGYWIVEVRNSLSSGSATWDLREANRRKSGIVVWRASLDSQGRLLTVDNNSPAMAQASGYSLSPPNVRFGSGAPSSWMPDSTGVVEIPLILPGSGSRARVNGVISEFTVRIDEWDARTFGARAQLRQDGLNCL